MGAPSPSPLSVEPVSESPPPTSSIITTTPLTSISSPAPLNDITSLAYFTVSFTPLLTAASTVQECGAVRFIRYYATVVSPTHYAISNIDGSSQSRLYSPLVAGTTVQESGRSRFACYYATAAPPSHYAVLNIDGSSQNLLCDFQTRPIVRRHNHSKAFYLLSDVSSHTFWLNECDDYLLKSHSVTTCWARYGNVEFRVLDPIELCTLNVVYGSGASHLKLFPVSIPISSNRYINFVLDYQLFFGTIAMGTKLKILFGFLHFTERDSSLYGSISSCFVTFPSFVLPLSMTPGFSASFVNVAL
ncbi:hypothetical protein Bca52824_013246 [Brassica carinata]|uniref:Uncharacterized protein n=1 Tax=Brassica carinata TaxID=52824 RepID=A0A8X8B373_BRACI|nr:hypothetical protein Bca52824_013246 [Brassica carinata]